MMTCCLRLRRKRKCFNLLCMKFSSQNMSINHIILCFKRGIMSIFKCLVNSSHCIDSPNKSLRDDHIRYNSKYDTFSICLEPEHRAEICCHSLKQVTWTLKSECLSSCPSSTTQLSDQISLISLFLNLIFSFVSEFTHV